jgi:hypothetical protein
VYKGFNEYAIKELNRTDLDGWFLWFLSND